MSRADLEHRSEKWLRTFCEKEADVPGYEATMEAISRSGGEDVHFGTDAGGEIPPEFWYHHEVVTGIHTENPPTYFSCSC